MPQNDKGEQNGDEEIIKELCVCNGMSYEKVSQDGSEASALEMFFSGFPRMVGLSLFPKLSSLTIVSQCVRQVAGLEHCPVLRELWVVECHLNEISGLQHCTQLQKLFLYDNKISEISGLDHLTNLQVLWLNSNRVSEIKGLSALENLRELNLSDNLIKTIGDSLDQNKNLQILNLSGNKISSFKELARLACLSRMRELSLKDPLCQPNPVCLLCNYSTHVLYHIPTLHMLDSYDVSSKLIKEAAESTVMKKLMYYSMRMRCVWKQFQDSKVKLLQHRAELLQVPEERIRTLSYTLKNLEWELSEVQGAARKSTRLWEEASATQSPPNCLDPGYEQQVQRKLDSVRERIKTWGQHLEQVEGSIQQDLTLESDRKDQLIHFLVMELETVGNIRFEEGNTSDVWFNSCYDLLTSRFCVWDYKPHSIIGIKINRIMRVHNRALRLRFKDKLHFLLDADESPLFSQNYKRWLEYLFYVSDPERSSGNNETLQILEEGFRPADSYKALGRDRAVPLTNSVNVCERLRIDHAHRQADKDRGRSTDDLPFRHGQLIVSKVFLGPSVPVRDGVPVDSDFYPKVHSVYHKASAQQVTTAQEKPCREALFSTEQQTSCDCSERQTLWYVFDHELILPEYLIDFEYITQEASQSSWACMPSSAPNTVAPNTVTSSSAPPPCCSMQAQDEAALIMQPALPPRPKLLTLDELSILTAAQATVLNQITVLNLHGNSLNKLKEISQLTALRHLTISFNKFTHLDDISYLPSLETVDASFNRVATLDGVRGLGRLRHLDLRWNQLSRAVEDVAVLHKHTPCLLHLDTRHNPWTQHNTVRMVFLGRLKMLTHLDGVLVTEEECVAALQMVPTSKISLECVLSHSRTVEERPRCLSLLTAAQLITHLQPSPWTHTHTADLEPGWAAKITALNVNAQHLTRITNLETLVNLRWASFNDNHLTRIEGLQHCPLLEELSFDNNSITSLDGVCELQHLVRLSINSNRLHSLDGCVLESLPNLHFLSVESNCISTLNGVQRSRSLFQLYAGNNEITTSRDIYHLKALSSLIILDLFGNPLVKKLENYRAYVVFHLPSLKGLDGVAVEPAESENAKDLFGGRLIPDMVAEKLGHSNFRDIVNLELTACSIRMVDLAPTDLFVNLRSINLEHNTLTSFSGLVCLPSVKVLCLNYNHIESILPCQKAQLHLRQGLYQKVQSSGYGQQNHSKTSREGLPGDNLEPLMASLEVLHLGYNSISSLGELQLSRLTNLRALFLQGNEISQVEGLEGLCHLRQLVLDRNRIKVLSEGSFCRQASLLELHLTENRLRDLSHLQPLTHLHRLFLDMNKIQDTAEVDKLEVLPSLTELSVVGNPMARRSLHRPAVVLRLPRLQVLDGITVTLEERTRAELMYTEGQYPSPPVVGADLTLPGLVPVYRVPPGRGPGLTSGLQHLLGHEIITNTHLEEPHHSNKRRGGGMDTLSAQSDRGCRHRGASSVPLAGPPPSQHRAYIPPPHTHTHAPRRSTTARDSTHLQQNLQ